MRELETERAAPSLGASEQSPLCEEKAGKKSSREGWLTQLWKVPWLGRHKFERRPHESIWMSENVPNTLPKPAER